MLYDMEYAYCENRKETDMVYIQALSHHYLGGRRKSQTNKTHIKVRTMHNLRNRHKLKEKNSTDFSILNSICFSKLHAVLQHRRLYCL
jgi:hypothetical protein